MAFKLVSREDGISPKEQKPSGLSEFARPYSAVAGRAVSGLVGLPQDIYSGVTGLANAGINAITGKENFIPSRLPYLPNSQEFFQNQIEPLYPKGYLQPKNFGERIAHGIAGDPTVVAKGLATGGASLPVDLARSAVAHTGMEGAKSTGFGPLGQFIAGTLGGVGFDLKRLGRTPGALPKVAKKLYEREYDSAKKEAAKITVPADNLSQTLDNLIVEADTLKTAGNRNAKKVLNSAGELINSETNTISGKSLWDLKKQVGDLSRDRSVGDVERSYYQRLNNSIQKELLQAAEDNPKFGNSYKKAEDLWKSVNLRSDIGEMIENNTGLKGLFKNKTAKALLGVGIGKYFGPGGLAISLPVSYGARYAARATDFLSGHPHAQQLLEEGIMQAVNGNRQAFATRMKELLTAYDKDRSDNHPKEKRFKKIS